MRNVIAKKIRKETRRWFCFKKMAICNLPFNERLKIAIKILRKDWL